MPQTDELLTAVPTREALDAAHLQALRALSDHIGSQGRSLEGVAKDLKDTRDAVLRLEAQELKATINSNRAEALVAIKELAGVVDKVDNKADANSRAISRIQGVFLPLGAFGAGALAFIGQLLANAAGRH